MFNIRPESVSQGACIRALPAPRCIPTKCHVLPTKVYKQVCSLLSLQMKFPCPVFPPLLFLFPLTLFEVGGKNSIHQLNEHLGNLKVFRKVPR